ncbi:HAMP domain-containing protein [Desulfovibrio sp. OttesenSCG-928-O18]|nr:HAMP domain-containing protein [Desulfovibrio sp. OttesenSCG-928-O18]
MRFALWKRIFVYTIALLVVSQVLAFILHNALFRGDMRRYFVVSAKSVAEDLTGQSVEAVLRHAKIYTHGRHRLWLANGDGSPIPGVDFSEEQVMRQKVVERWEEEGVVLAQVESEPRFWAKVPVTLREGSYLMYMSFGPPPRPLEHAILIQLVAPVLIVSCALALWMAWSVSRPLRRLRNEVREMSETGPGCKVTVAGKDEIAEVAGAVNAMADSLDRHVNGMRALIANVSHELRSPLARATIALGIIEESLPPEYVVPFKGMSEGREKRPASREEMAARYLAGLQEELNHMDTLIGTTLLTQKLEMQQESVHMERLDFSLLCADIWQRYKLIFRRSAFVPEGDIAEGCEIFGNRPLLLQILTNLLDNSLKYTSKGGLVRLTLNTRSGNCMLCVENSYEGADEAKLEHIFDPFYRMDQATGTGVGLGLALVQKTVSLHGGEIMAVPTDLGVCVCMQLPLASPAGESR